MTLNNLLLPWSTIVLWVLVIGAAVALWFVSKRSQQRREEEMKAKLDAIRPGCKVKTIGGVCGTVVEVCPEENTFVLETGSETAGKSYVTFDRTAVYQMDALSEEAPASAPVEASEEVFEEVAEVEAPEEEVVETAEEPKEE